MPEPARLLAQNTPPINGNIATKAKETKTRECSKLLRHRTINFFINQWGAKGIIGGRWTPLRIAPKGLLNSMGLLISRPGQSCSQAQEPQNPGLRALDPPAEVFVAAIIRVTSLHRAKITSQETCSHRSKLPFSVSTILTAFDNYFRHCFL